MTTKQNDDSKQELATNLGKALQGEEQRSIGFDLEQNILVYELGEQNVSMYTIVN